MKFPSEWMPGIRSAIQGGDGATLVQILTAEGLLLDFAERIASQWPPGRYPDTAPYIAAALLRWRGVMG